MPDPQAQGRPAVDFSAGLVSPNTPTPSATPDFSSGLVGATPPSTSEEPAEPPKPPEKGFFRSMWDALTSTESSVYSHNPMPADVTVEKLRKSTEEQPALSRGIEKGLTATLSDTSQLAGKAADKLGLRHKGLSDLVTGDQPRGIFGEAPASDVETKPEGTAEHVGFGMETVVEFMAGDEILKGLSYAAKLQRLSKAVKVLEQNPRLTRWLATAIRQGTVGAGQAGLHGEAPLEAGGLTALTSFGSSALIEAGGPLLRRLVPRIIKVGGQDVRILASQAGEPGARAAEGATKITGVSGEHELKKFAAGQAQDINKAMGGIANRSATETAGALEDSAKALSMEPEDLQKLTDAHDKLASASSFGEAAESMKAAAAEHFKILDEATNGELAALKAERNSLFKALRNPANNQAEISKGIADVAKKEDQVFKGIGIGEGGRTVLDEARMAWKKALALEELDARVARVTKEAIGPGGIDEPLVRTVRGGGLLKQLNDMGPERLTLALGDAAHVADMRKLGALLQDSQNVAKLSISMRLLRGSRLFATIHHPVAVAGTEGISFLMGKVLTNPAAAGKVAEMLKAGATAPAIASALARIWSQAPASTEDTGAGSSKE